MRDYNIDSLDVTIQSPTKQVVTGRAGVHSVNLFEMKAMSLRELHAFSEKNSFYSPDFEERERKFWRSIACPGEWEDPVYGADEAGTLFEGKDCQSWNVDKLQSLLTFISKDLPGVTGSYLYVGTWRAMFAYHTEDMDLHSINYLHTGAAKSWYSVPVEHRKRFESMAQSFFPIDYRDCSEFLRHKSKLFSPRTLQKYGIPFNTVVQEAGEFIITFPGSYHAGFNHGFNIAESTNFATPRWLEIGKKAKVCLCRMDSVSIDVDFVETLYLRNLRSKKTKTEGDVASMDVFNQIQSSRIRCVCPGKINKKHSVDISTCTGCGVKFHESCNGITNAAQDLLCSICSAIEQLPSEDKIIETNLHTPNELSKNSCSERELEKNCIGVVKKRQRKRKLSMKDGHIEDKNEEVVQKRKDKSLVRCNIVNQKVKNVKRNVQKFKSNENGRIKGHYREDEWLIAKAEDNFVLGDNLILYHQPFVEFAIRHAVHQYPEGAKRLLSNGWFQELLNSSERSQHELCSFDHCPIYQVRAFSF
jgi:jumonji domain-containing protein 2